MEKNLPRAGAHADGGLGMVDDEEKLRQVAKARELQKTIFDGGFAGIRYPVEYGGQILAHSLSLVATIATSDELSQAWATA